MLVKFGTSSPFCNFLSFSFNSSNSINDKISVLWKPELCQHSTRCWKLLPLVFNPKLKKWINPDGASPEEIENQVRKCPSGALTAIKL